ncbi:unnamed protein product [Peronospora belbahrii]|uniref:SCP domain-containing protein n=1 Tax=Peronospora belbahrii TaxID=622444 RepID=A0AAU9KYW9_9STRA|nr:unnamed protein product [Peronospora belbahrii]CAH0514534.1 unnamed protein product [Peronospora belbahrii]
MCRIGWSPDLAIAATTTATKCLATSAPGVNVYQSSTNNSVSLIDDAIQQWVIETSMTTLKTLTQPGASDVEVGQGTYNLYSQILWASTTSVGCAVASCLGGQMVVCEFSPAGNDGSSAWYIHANTASKCPSGTTASQGLCIVEGDAANDPIAPIPAGKLTYEVYPAYVANMQTLLIETARSIANGQKPQAIPSSPTDTTPVPISATSETSLISAMENGSLTAMDKTDKTSMSTSGYSNSSPMASSPLTKIDKAPTSTSGYLNSSPAAASPSAETGTTSTSTSGYANSSPTASSPSTETEKSSTSTSGYSNSSPTASSPSIETEKSSSSLSTSTKTEKPTMPSLSTDPSSKFSPKQDSQSTTPLRDKEDTGPGTVKASSGSGSTFMNQDTSSNIDDPPSINSDESKVFPPTSKPGAATSINNKTSKSSGSGISVAGMAGIAMLTIVVFGSIGVVISYKRNQQRQREIMRDGGIRII